MKRATRAQRLRQILGAERAAVVVEIDAGGSGDIGEVKAEVGLRGRSQQGNSAQQKTPPVHAMLTSPLRIA